MLANYSKTHCQSPACPAVCVAVVKCQHNVLQRRRSSVFLESSFSSTVISGNNNEDCIEIGFLNKTLFYRFAWNADTV